MLASRTIKNKRLSVSMNLSPWVPPPNLSPLTISHRNRNNHKMFSMSRRKSRQSCPRDKGKDVILLTTARTWTGVTGLTLRTNDIIGSYRFTTNILWIDTWDAWIKSSKQWKLSSAPDKQNSAAAIIRKWRKSIMISSPLSKTSDFSTTILRISSQLYLTFRLVESSWLKN